MTDGYSPTTRMAGQDQYLPPPPPLQQDRQQRSLRRRTSSSPPPPPLPAPKRRRRQMITSLARIVLVLGGCTYILISQLVASTTQFRTVLLKNLLIDYWQANNIVVNDINLNIPETQQEDQHDQKQQQERRQQQQHHRHKYQSSIPTADISTLTSTATTTPPTQYQHDDRRKQRRDSKNNERPEQNISHHHHDQPQQQHEDHSNTTGHIVYGRDNNNTTTSNTSDPRKPSFDVKKKKETSSSQTIPESTPAKLLDSSDADSGSLFAAPRIPQQEPQSQLQVQKQKHVVFIGDGTILSRNAFMEWLHRRHYHHQHHHSDFTGNNSGLENCPIELIDEKIHGSKQEYVDWSTNYFVSNNGRSGSRSMSESQLYFNTTYLSNIRDSNNVNVVVESIHYRSRSGNSSWHATYIDLPEENDIFNSSFIARKDLSNNLWEMIFAQTISKPTNLHQSQPATTIPTAIVITCPGPEGSEGRRKRVAHPRQIRRILEDAYDATNKEGIVIWRPSYRTSGGMGTSLRTATAVAPATMTTTTKDGFLNDNYDPGAHPSETEIDLEVEKLSHNFPWLIYQHSHQSEQGEIAVQDTNSAFNPAAYYRDLNRQVESVLEPTRKHHRVFILVGGARTMESTIISYMNNFVLPLCPPHTCVGHLVTHLSSADNRPSATTDDPLGQVVAGHDANITQYLKRFPLELHVHPVKGYDIGSVEEQVTMDLIEAATTNTTIRQRIRMLRFADPRRYSMWSARAWAWGTVEELSKLYDFDFFAFTRPDLLWLTSVNTADFFKKFESEKRNDVWVHDVYFNNVPDTFALFTSMDAARRYFSLEELVRPGVACLGGPTFNDTLVASRLEQSGISTSPIDWCKNVPSPTEDQGWSERILRRKLEKADLQVRYFSASAVLLRYFERPDKITVLKAECFALNRFTHIGFAATNANVSGSSFVGCAQMADDVDQDFPTSSLANFSLPTYQTFYVQNKARPDECLEFFNETMYSTPCDRFAATQMFAGSNRNDIVGLTYSCFKTGNCPMPGSFLIPNNSHNFSFGSGGEWEKVPVLLNHAFPYNHWQLKTGRN